MSHVTTRNLKLTHCLRALLYRRNAALALMAPGLAFAGPGGEVVVGGEADIVRPDANRTVINQFTDRAAINWQTFSVDADEYVIFNQPGASSIVLNRVLGGDASYILGHMQSNGQVFLLNPNGVYFTYGASLDVQGFLASTLDMNPADFMAGAFTLARSDSAPATARVINDGRITAGPGGYVVLAGDYTENTGIITANAGSIALVSGNALTLDIEGDGLVSFAIDEATLSDAAGVHNAGSLIADGGRVIMTAKVASDLVTTAVNNEGLVRAHSIEERRGEIYLVGNGGDVVNAGTLDADGENADGGRIIAYSDRDMTLADGAVQTAAGDENHEGGLLRFIAKDHLDYQRDNIIRATGGISGGFVEVSGHGSINLRGIPQIGAGGQFLIDPSIIQVSSGAGSPNTSVGTAGITRVGVGYIGTQLNAGVDVSLIASSSIVSYNITVTPTTIGAGTGTGNLLLGIGSITTTGGASSFGGVLTGGPPSISPLTGGNISISNIDINIQGNVDISASQGTISTGLIATNSGITVSGGSVAIGSLGNATNVSVTASSAAASGGNISIGAGGFGSQVGNVTLNAAGGANGGNITVERLVAGGILNFTASSTGGTSGGVVTVGAGSALTGISDSAAGANITINGNAYNGQGGLYVGGGVTINTNVTGQMLLVGASTNAADFVTVNGNVAVSGNATAWAGGISNAQINVSGSFDAGNIELHTAGAGSGDSPAIILGGPVTATNNIDLTAVASGLGGFINLGSYASAGGNIGMSATGAGNGGNVTVATGLQATGNININADGGTSNGGNITISAGGISASSGSVTLGAAGGNFAGGNITVVGAGPKGIAAANGITLTAFANGAATVSDAAVINVSGQVQGGNGNVTINANNIGTGQGGSVLIAGNASNGQVRGQAVSITAANGNTNGGRIRLGLGSPGSSFGGANVTALGGNIDLAINGGQGVVHAGALNATGNITLTGAALRQVYLANYTGGVPTTLRNVNAGGNFTVNVSGSNAVFEAGNISGNNVGITATSPFSGGDIKVGNISGNGSVALNATGTSGGGISAGGITGALVNVISNMSASVVPGVTINGPLIATTGNAIFNVTNAGGSATLTLNDDVTADGSVDFNISGPMNNTVHINGDVHAINGNIFFNSTVTTIDYGAGTHEIKAGGNILITDGQSLNGSAGFVDYVTGGDFVYNNSSGTPGTFAARDITAGGIVSVNAVGNGLHIVRDIAGGHVDMHFTGSNSIGGNSLDVSINSIQATGTGPGFHDAILEVHDVAGGFASNASISVGNISTAQGEVVIRNFGGGDGTDTGTVTVGNIATQNFVSIETPGDITTGTINVSRTGGPVSVDLRSFRDSFGNGGDITVNGNIAASGRANATNPQAAGVFLETLASGGRSITVTGDISITGAGQNYSNATSNGHMGNVHFSARAEGGSVSLNNISMTGVGAGWLEVQAANATIGNIGMNIASGNYTRDFTLTDISSDCGVSVTCNLAGQERMLSGGRAEININNSAVPPSVAAATFGNVNITAPNAHMSVSGFGDISGGGIAITGTGAHFEVSSAGTFDGQAIVYNQVSRGGGANVFLAGSSNGLVRLNGAVDLSARGNAELVVMGNTIKVRNVSVETSAGTFERSGEPAPLGFNDGPFENDGGAGPRIDEGTITGGAARVSLSGYNASPSFAPVSADTVGVNGAISVSGAGRAGVDIRGDDVTVSGNITATATRGQQDGTFASLDSGVSVSGTVVSDWGNAHVDISGSGDVQLANVSITGPAASGRVEGVNVRAGAISVTANGGELHVVETRVAGGSTETLEVDGPNIFTGLALFADNTLELTGDLDMNAVGAGGALLSGSTIRTRNISINVADAAYTVKTPELFSGAATDFTAGNALLGIIGATAQVNGDISITAGQQAHFGGAANVSGNFSINAGTGITRTIPATVQFLNRLDSEDDDVSIVLPAAFNVQASNIDLNTVSGPLVLNGAVLRAANALTLSTGGNMAVSDVTFSGTTVQMTAGGNISNSNPAGSITAGALAIFAGGNVNLANTVLTVGNGNFADITGDAMFLRLLAAEDLAAPTAGPSLAIRGRAVALGTVSVAGDYISLETDALQINGTVSTGDPDLLLQVAPFATGTMFGFEQSTGTGTSYVYNGTLDRFDAATIALGTTSHTGDVFIGRNGGVNIGDTNLFVLTTGNITGLERVTSTGIVKDLFTLINGEFDVPQTNEIDTGQDLMLALNDQYALDDGGTDEEEEGDEEGEDTDTDADVEEEDDSLIRQDTVDEEMMCK